MSKNRRTPNKDQGQGFADLPKLISRANEHPNLPEAAVKAMPSCNEVDAMTNETKAAFSERLEKLDRVLNDLYEKHTAERDNIKKRLAEIKQTETKLAENAKEQDGILTQLDERDKELMAREQAIELRELDARNGFVTQQREALKAFKDEIRHLKDERDEVIARTEQDERDARQRIDVQHQNFRREQQDWRDAWAQKDKALEDERVRVDFERQRLEQAQRNQDAIKRQMREEINDDYRREINELNRKIALAHRNAEQDAEMIQQLREELAGFASLNRLLEHEGFVNADALIKQFQALRSENRQLRDNQRHRSDDDLEIENETLHQRCDDYEQRFEDQVRMISELKNELSTRRVSVLEKQVLEQERRVLEQHKRALDSAVFDLEQRLDDLTTRQQGISAFEALQKMDQEFVGMVPVEDVPALDDFARKLRQLIAGALDTDLYYPEQTIRIFLGGLAMSQLHILQGISGTGKTSLALAFAKAVGGHCTTVPVQAGWRDRDDLLGHFNAFERRFYERECLQAIYRASTEKFKDRINVILLDEMNLSHPEQYFAEFLSALEVPTNQRRIVLTETALPDPPSLLRGSGCEGRKLPLPENLWFIGTANEDETTKGFADKTFDRAHVMELREKDTPFPTETSKNMLPYRFTSLKHRFDEAQNKHFPSVKSALNQLQSSDFTRSLEKEFGLGWSNRLERQALRFVPVVIAAGGSLGEAFDHLLATRLFRAGKITERFDINIDALREIELNLIEAWKQIDLQNDPLVCMERLERDIKRKEQQG